MHCKLCNANVEVLYDIKNTDVKICVSCLKQLTDTDLLFLCNSCGIVHFANMYNDKWDMCIECAEKYIKNCDICGAEFDVDAPKTYSYNDINYCAKCAETHLYTCTECGNIYPDSELTCICVKNVTYDDLSGICTDKFDECVNNCTRIATFNKMRLCKKCNPFK